MTLSEVAETAEEAVRQGRVMGVRLPLDDEEEPWAAPPSRRKLQPPIAGRLPESIEAVLANQIYIPREGLPAGLVNRLIRARRAKRGTDCRSRVSRGVGEGTEDRRDSVAAARDRSACSHYRVWQDSRSRRDDRGTQSQHAHLHAVRPGTFPRCCKSAGGRPPLLASSHPARDGIRACAKPRWRTSSDSTSLCGAGGERDAQCHDLR